MAQAPHDPQNLFSARGLVALVTGGGTGRQPLSLYLIADTSSSPS